MATINSDAKVAVLHMKNLGEDWDPWRLVILIKSLCFACKKHRRELGPIEASNSDANYIVLHAQNDR